MKNKHLPILVSLFVITSFALQLFPTYASTNQTIKLATWNIKDLSTSSRSDFELMQISYILQNYDFIAIQEVNNEQAIERLIDWLEVLGHSYKYLFSPLSGTGSGRRALCLSL